MKKNVLTLLMLMCSFTFYAQDKITDELKVLTNSQQYDKIIEQYASKYKDYSAKSLYYIGQAYYIKENDQQCLRFMDLSIQKDLNNPAAYFLKANTYYYMGKYTESVKCYRVAIRLKNDDSQFYSGLGDSYYKLNNPDSALVSYQKAISLPGCMDRPYSMAAQIYVDKQDTAKALVAYYAAKDKISHQSESYKNALFNIGTFEYLKANMNAAESAFLELVKIDSTDYFNYPKLIQIAYSRKDYNTASRYKSVLYAAHQKGLLKDYLKDMFCFDQFRFKDKLIQAYERYQDDSTKLYEKHRFYVVNKADQIDYKIQTENSSTAIEQGNGRYMLCMTKDNIHASYGLVFDTNFNYEDLKSKVIDIIDGKIKPVATTIFKSK